MAAVSLTDVSPSRDHFELGMRKGEGFAFRSVDAYLGAGNLEQFAALQVLEVLRWLLSFFLDWRSLCFGF